MWNNGQQPPVSPASYASTSYQQSYPETDHSPSSPLSSQTGDHPGYVVDQGNYYSTTSFSHPMNPFSRSQFPPDRITPQTMQRHRVSHTFQQSPHMQVDSQSQFTHIRSRSPTQASYTHSAPLAIPRHPPSYEQPQAISISPQFPATSKRPFTCDLCSFSFNRHHDLKRHRETHTGEKPFFCNGGCGKTFTRKDALKRHQLVKGCGNTDEWT